MGSCSPRPIPSTTRRRSPSPSSTTRAEYRFYLAGTSSIALRAEDTRSIRELHPSAIHVGTLGLVVEPMASTLEAFVAAASDDVVVMVDPNCRPSVIADPAAFRARIARVLHRADVVKVSHEDLAYLDPGRATDDAARAMLGSGTSAPSVVLVTNQSAAAVIHTRQDELRVHVPSVAVVDTVGAGDAFGGAFLAWWVASGLGRSDLPDSVALRVAVEFAVGVAAMTCERAGADPPRFGELGELRARWPGRSEPAGP
jgi:fructokinase